MYAIEYSLHLQQRVSRSLQQLLDKMHVMDVTGGLGSTTAGGPQQQVAS